MDFQIVHVLFESADLDRVEALFEPPSQRRALINPEIEPASTAEVLQQGVENPGSRHETCRRSTRFISTPGMSANSSTWSALPLSIAALGIPLNSATFCTSTVPCIRLIALTPIEPSPPDPLNTTPIAWSLNV